LKRPLGGAEVRQVQADVGVDHPHQRHVREVKPLGDHLRAQQDLHFPLAEGIQQTGMAAGAFHGIAVHAADVLAGKFIDDLCFELLGADALVA
jgi:hypothetical protein